ncbi:WD40-repeat-containing domain protein [Mycena vitilis]|nr:WD40-repeat-containing domain protein [Mycena vitilis]
MSAPTISSSVHRRQSPKQELRLCFPRVGPGYGFHQWHDRPRELNGNESPDQLPPELVPPSSRQLGESVDLVCDLLKHALPLVPRPPTAPSPRTTLAVPATTPPATPRTIATPTRPRARISQQTGTSTAMRETPTYHPPWKLVRVISGHLGWVRSVAAEPGNQWFATGAGDRVIKIWDLASGELKLSLTGHISTVRGPAVSLRHPYLFSCGEDRCVLHHYHGHLSGVYALSLHPTLDILVTAGRDASARVWDMRTKAQIHVLSGPTATVADVKCQESEPQVIMITGSMDSTVRLWDLAAGKTRVTLTHHKKSVRVLAIHPTEYSSASGLAGDNNIKKWKCPDGAFVFNSSGYNAIINTLSVNAEGVFSGADNGSLAFWDYNTGTSFQNMEDVPQPGSLEAEAGVYCSTFDMTGTRLITGGADKTIKVRRLRVGRLRRLAQMVWGRGYAAARGDRRGEG